MATWTSPITWTTGGVTAAQFNQQIRDNETWLKGAFTQLGVTSDSAKSQITPSLCGCKATKAALQTIANNTNTALTLDTELFDSNNMHSLVTNNSRITIPASMAGWYVIGAQAEFAANGTGNRRVYLQVNGATIIAMDTRVGTASQATHISCSTLHQFAVADYVEAFVFQTSGGNLDVAANDLSPMMWIHRQSST